MKNRRFVFAGNRFFVLKEMLDAGLDVGKILAVKDSHLEKELIARKIPYRVIGIRGELMDILYETSFDYCVTNGFPYILRLEDFKKSGKIFINIHPSYLPDLRGADPVPGALLYGRDCGATCHVMDEGIDTGDIISQVRIPYSPDLDAGLLYQLSFQAEREAFRLALERKFEPLHAQAKNEAAIYYTKKPADLQIDFTKTAESILQCVRAFSNKSQGAQFSLGDNVFKVYDAHILTNPYLLSLAEHSRENAVMFKYEDTLIIKKSPVCLKLKNIVGELSGVAVGTVLA